MLRFVGDVHDKAVGRTLACRHFEFPAARHGNSVAATWGLRRGLRSGRGSVPFDRAAGRPFGRCVASWRQPATPAFDVCAMTNNIYVIRPLAVRLAFVLASGLAIMREADPSGFFCSRGCLRMADTAILIDGGYLLKRLPAVRPDIDATDADAVAQSVNQLVRHHLNQLNDVYRVPNAFQLLYRTLLLGRPTVWRESAYTRWQPPNRLCSHTRRIVDALPVGARHRVNWRKQP